MPDYKLAARRAARKYGINEGIFLAMIQQESGFNPNVSSPAGAQGIAQFIPSTAKAYGVNLGDGRVTDDLEGAAKYLRANLKRTGGNYSQALSIYNSGRPDGYKSIPETINYVKNIRAMSKRYGGSTPAPRSSSGGGRNVSSQGGTKTTTTVTGAGFDPGSGPGASALAQLAQQQARPTITPTVPSPPQFAAQATMPQGYQAPSAAPVQQQGSSLTDLLSAVSSSGQSIPETNVKTTTTKTDGGGSGSASSSGGGGKRPKGDFGGQLLELFYNGKGGVNVKNGQRVKTGFVSGHTDHVHVAAGPKTVKTLARLAQDMGLTVRELAPFDTVDPVHVQGSYHYRKQAADISGDPAKMAAYSRRVAKLFGVKA